MTKSNRLSFVVPAALMCLSGILPMDAPAQGWPQQIAMWHPQQWPEYRPTTPDAYWGSRSESAPAQAKSGEPQRREGLRTPRRAAKSTPQGAAPAEQRASKTKAFRNRGIASWYGKRFHGRKTASGQRYDMHAMTAAHRTLPLPSYVRVTNPSNGSSVVVLINDRGPYVGKRIIDLSYAAANALGITKRGTAMVELDVIPNPILASAEQTTRREASPPLEPPVAID